MSHINDSIGRLVSARDEVTGALAAGPLRTGELIEKLGYSAINFLLTRMIGDRAGHWDESPHQLALSDLIEDGTVQYWYDAELDVNYGLAGKPATPPADKCGEHSKAFRQAVAWLDAACNFIGEKVEVEPVFTLVRELGWLNQVLTLSIEGTAWKISDWDYVAGAGGSYEESGDWREDTPESVGKRIVKAFQSVEHEA